MNMAEKKSKHEQNSLSTDTVPISPTPSLTDSGQTEIQGHEIQDKVQSGDNHIYERSTETSGDTHVHEPSTETSEDTHGHEPSTETSGDTYGHERSTESFENIPEPPQDWQFNVFLMQLADKLSMQDLQDMKYLFEGEGGIGRGVLDKIQTPRDLFRILRTRGYISRDNLLYLQVILFLTGRKDLVQEAVDHSKTIGNILHFYAPSDQPENGYKYVKFHVDGKDFRSYTRDDINILRLRMAKLLFVPQQFVIIRGIEPSSSLLVTLMIPEMYVEILRDLLENGEKFSELCDIGVDTVEVDGEGPFDLTGSCMNGVEETEQQKSLVNVYEHLQQTKAQLDESETACIELSRQMDHLQRKVDTQDKDLDHLQLKVDTQDKDLCKTKSELEALKKVFTVSHDGSQPASLKEQSSLKDFTVSLHKVSLEAVDRTVILRLLDATVNIVSTSLRESHRLQVEKMRLDLQEMKSKLLPLIFELEQYKFLTNLSSIDKSTLDSLRVMLQTLIAPALSQEIQISITPHGLQVMEKISNKLRLKEKEKLKQKYKWNPEERIEKWMNEHQNRFLAGLYCKEIEQKNVHVDCESFLAQCLTEVNREDLKKFLKQKPSTNPQSPRFNAGERPNQSRQYGQEGGRQQKSPWQQQAQDTAHGQQHQSDLPDQTTLITRMAQQIQEMYDMLQTKQGAYSSSFGAWKTPNFSFDEQSFLSGQAI